MNSGRRISPRSFLCLTLLVAALLIFSTVSLVFAQSKTTAHAPAPSRIKADAPAKSVAPPADNEYSKKIKEYTTETYFMTELVDHLPMSDKVPSPDKVLGYIVGTPNKLTYSKDLYRYYRELARTQQRACACSPRRRNRKKAKNKSWWRSATKRCSPSSIATKRSRRSLPTRARSTETEAQSLIGEGKVFYWASGSIHSPETGSPEMLMELAYRLAVEESPFIQAIRKNVIVLITPVLEVDGRDMMVDLYNYRKANPGKNCAGAGLLGQVCRAR